MAHYSLTVKATEDLAVIWAYTLRNWSEEQADEYYNFLIASCSKIASNPRLYGKRYDEIYAGLRGYKARKHILFYIILASNDIKIIRILHERMDLRKRLIKR